MQLVQNAAAMDLGRPRQKERRRSAASVRARCRLAQRGPPRWPPRAPWGRGR